MKYIIQFFLLVLLTQDMWAQTGSIKGSVKADGKGIEAASIVITGTAAVIADLAGNFKIANVNTGKYLAKISAVGYLPVTKSITVTSSSVTQINIQLSSVSGDLNAVVVTGTMKTVSKSASAIPVEVYTPKFFQKNPTPNLFEAVGMINGVKPQLNCNVCNTGDIHINGMEGPYTLVLIDGMPIVSALSTVYGLSGIPNSMVERIEVVKGPAASLYGSEAMGGIINVITKSPVKAPLVSVDVFGITWQEYSTDVTVKFKMKNAQSLLGLNYYNYQNRLDKNKDGFTDVTLQNRLSVFNKWSFSRKENRVASVGLRFVNEDRFGGEMNWNKQWRGSDSIYGESIYTKRFEIIGAYQLPVKEKIMFQFSYNLHDQNSYYGKIPYMANQKVAFGQLYWDKTLNAKHDLLFGASYRYTYYDDNTPATASADLLKPKNQPAKTPLPGVFIQDEWKLSKVSTLLAGYRYDYDKYHGNIHSPRIAYKWSLDNNNTLRASFGTGFRVVNLFTEDHAALTGARQVVIKEALKPEKSFNSNLNYVVKIPAESFFVGLDMTAFYSYFTNKITGDFDTNPDKIFYNNLRGHAVSQGLSLNTDATFSFPLKLLAGVTYLDVYQKNDDGAGKQNKTQQLLAARWSGTFQVSYTLPQKITVDFTGTFTGPMRLPIQKNDYRPEYSPWFSLANIQLTKKFGSGIELYGGVKNIFNFVPKYSLIRSFDPFDKTVNDRVTNPNGYTFDTEYNFAPMQGIRGFFGLRYNLM
ncbi:MAG: TonB-dependent receptor plug [Ferruginibacter sp.]|nr:TonB-dependent receptor plug [Ferruginibacter sp.]